MTRTTIDSVFRDVTASVTLTGESGDDPFESGRRWHHRAWSVTLRFEGRELTTPYYTGLGGGEPSARSVLESLASDAATVVNSDGFEEWADDLAFDPGSRQAKDTYRATVDLTAQLRTFLGDAFDRFVFETEY